MLLSLWWFVCFSLHPISLGLSRTVTLLSAVSSDRRAHFNMASSSTDDTSNLDYFAIGSMMNPVSITSRGIHPISSEPAELLNFRIGFFTSQGFAEAIPEENSSCHGVIHHLTKADMDKLDKIEQLYDRRTATARLYDGTTRQVTVYVQSDVSQHSSDDDAQPTERYIEIMTDGCRHYGVDQKYIEFLENHEKVPRPTPDEYLTFGSANDCETIMTLDEVLENNGLDGKPLYMSINGKVVEATYSKDSKEFQEFCHVFQHMGQIGELFLSKVSFARNALDRMLDRLLTPISISDLSYVQGPI